MAVSQRQQPKTKSSWLKRMMLSWLCLAFLGWLVLISWTLVSWANEGFEAALTEVKHLTVLQSMSVRDLSDSSLMMHLNHYVATHITPHSQKAMQKAQETGAHLSLKTQEQVVHLLPEQQSPVATGLVVQINLLWQKAHQFGTLLEATGQLLLVKLTILVAAIPLFLLAITAGLVDGLNQRAIRTASLGRESTYVFHKSIPLARKALFWVLGLWLAIPQAFSPSLLFVSLSVLLSFMVSVTSSRFKKYL